MQAEL